MFWYPYNPSETFTITGGRVDFQIGAVIPAVVLLNGYLFVPALDESVNITNSFIWSGVSSQVGSGSASRKLN